MPSVPVSPCTNFGFAIPTRPSSATESLLIDASPLTNPTCLSAPNSADAQFVTKSQRPSALNATLSGLLRPGTIWWISALPAGALAQPQRRTPRRTAREPRMICSSRVKKRSYRVARSGARISAAGLLRLGRLLLQHGHELDALRGPLVVRLGLPDLDVLEPGPLAAVVQLHVVPVHRQAFGLREDHLLVVDAGQHLVAVDLPDDRVPGVVVQLGLRRVHLGVLRG